MRPSRTAAAVSVSLFLLALSPAAAQPARKGGATTVRMYDARVAPSPSLARKLARRLATRAASLSVARGQAQTIATAVGQARAAQPGLEVELSPVTGAPSSFGMKVGFLTAAAPGRSSEEIARSFLRDHGSLFGLSAADVDDLVSLGDSSGGSSGLRMLRMEQRIAGRPIFQSETRFLLDREGRLSRIVGLMVPHARAYAPTDDAAWRLTAPEAVTALLSSLGHTAKAGAFHLESSGEDGRLRLAERDELVAGPITARQILFPIGPGALEPAWSLVVFTAGDADWYAVVDAETGDVLWRKDIRDSASAQDARFRVYVQADGTTPADSPAPQSPTMLNPGDGTQFDAISPTVVSMHTAYDAVASQDGWIDDCPMGGCTADQTQTLGNNVLACMDQDQGGDANICDTSTSTELDGNGRPTGNPDTNSRNRDFLGTSPRDFETNYLPPPQTTAADAEVGQTCTGSGSSGTAAIDQFRRGMVTQLFYVANWYHDQLYELGFDEAAGNFQETNFTGMGAAGDRVLADADDGSGTNNANFSTPPDGTSGRVQMYRFTGPTVDRDGALDSVVLMHELTHGVSNRLIGDGAGLNWSPGAGMGEGWSDFVALSLLNDTNADDPDAEYPGGAYATYKLIPGFTDNYLYAIRRFPYSTDNSVNPLTWADVDDVTNDLSGGITPSPIDFNDNGGMEVHNIGEVWASSLWEVRSRVIADPAGANGDVPTGNHTMLQLVIDGMKMTPVSPTFTDARDALLNADCATNSCANEDSIWGGFADRGLGYGAKTPFAISFGYTATHMGVQESFDLPYLDVVDPATDVVIDDSAGNNNGAIDPGEPVDLTVTLTNPWRAAAKAVTSATATLSSTTPGVTILDDTAAYGAIAPTGTAAANDPFTIQLDPGVACGSSIDFTLTTVSDLGTTSTHFSLRVGTASGTDPVVTYSHSPDLAIPDARPRAAYDQMTITDDYQIADLNFRVDSLTHTYDGDLTVGLRSPTGAVGNDLISLIDGLTDGGPGDNLTNMVIDDDLTPSLSNDMVVAMASAAPYTGSWVPVFNGVWPGFAGFGPSDPVGQLSRFDGLSTKGTWSAMVSDQFPGDTGTLNTWSMLVTPTHFVCTVFTPALSATKTVSGTFQRGGDVVYTVTLTNSGTAPQADNPGDEFTDVLPADLNLLSASASSGTAVANTGTNTVTWNGSLAAMGGSVTITINAQVDPGATASIITNQGTVSYDSDANGTNDATLLTDDPGVGGSADPTSFSLSVLAVPTLSETSLAALALLLLAAGWALAKR